MSCRSLWCGRVLLFVVGLSGASATARSVWPVGTSAMSAECPTGGNSICSLKVIQFLCHIRARRKIWCVTRVAVGASRGNWANDGICSRHCALFWGVLCTRVKMMHCCRAVPETTGPDGMGSGAQGLLQISVPEKVQRLLIQVGIKDFRGGAIRWCDFVAQGQ